MLGMVDRSLSNWLLGQCRLRGDKRRNEANTTGVLISTELFELSMCYDDCYQMDAVPLLLSTGEHADERERLCPMRRRKIVPSKAAA